MRVLLDAHTLIWAVDDPAKLGPDATTVLQDPTNDLLLSAGTIWEISIKAGLGKLSLSLPFRQWMEQAIHDLGATVLPITVEYADVLSGLPAHHGPPWATHGDIVAWLTSDIFGLEQTRSREAEQVILHNRKDWRR